MEAEALEGAEVLPLLGDVAERLLVATDRRLVGHAAAVARRPALTKPKPRDERKIPPTNE